MLFKVSSIWFFCVVVDDKLKLLPKDILLQLYYSFINTFFKHTVLLPEAVHANIYWISFLNYGNAIRLVTISTYNAHTANLFRYTNILQIQKGFFYVFCVTIVMFKFCKCQLPSIFSHLF